MHVVGLRLVLSLVQRIPLRNDGNDDESKRRPRRGHPRRSLSVLHRAGRAGRAGVRSRAGLVDRGQRGVGGGGVDACRVPRAAAERAGAGRAGGHPGRPDLRRPDTHERGAASHATAAGAATRADGGGLVGGAPARGRDRQPRVARRRPGGVDVRGAGGDDGEPYRLFGTAAAGVDGVDGGLRGLPVAAHAQPWRPDRARAGGGGAAARQLQVAAAGDAGAAAAGQLAGAGLQRGADRRLEQRRCVAGQPGGIAVADYGATAGLIGNSIVALMREPEEERAQSPDAAVLVQIVSRFDPPVHNTRRYTSQTARFGDVHVPAGQTILVLLAAANRDRQAAGRVFGFGYGPHTCPGHALACAIAAGALERLLMLALIWQRGLSWTYRPSLNVRMPAFTQTLDAASRHARGASRLCGEAVATGAVACTRFEAARAGWSRVPDAAALVRALLHQRAAAAVAMAFADGRHAAVGIEHQRVGGADFLDLRAPVVAEFFQCQRRRAAGVARFDVGAAVVALGQARRVHRLVHGHAQVDVVEHRLQHGGDDGRAARTADRERRLAVLEGQQRRHAAARALARFRHVGCRA